MELIYKCFKLFLSINNLRFIIGFIFLDIIFIIGIFLTIINLSKIKYDNLNLIKEIYQNESFPMFHFYVGLESPSSDFLAYDSFYTWQGTNKKSKKELKPVKIKQIFKNQFFYEKSNLTYFDYLNMSVKEGEICNDNYKKCGILDSKKNIMCIPNNEECPLNDFKLSEIELSDILPGYSHIELVESITGIKKYLYFTNNKIDNNIITNFKLSFDSPCIHPKEHSWISMNRDEKEKTCNCFTYIDGKLYDQNYIEVGNNVFMKSLYYDNEINIFNDFSSEKVKLFTKNYYYIKEDCSKNFINNYTNLQKKRENLISNIKLLEIISFIFIIIHLAFIFYISNNKKNSLIIIIILNIIISFFIVLNSSIIISVNNEKNLDFSCGDEIINAKIKYLINNDLIIIKKIIFFIFISLSISIMELIIQNYVLCSKQKKIHFKKMQSKSELI